MAACEGAPISTEAQRAYARRILLARMRLLQKQGFFGLLLMHLQFSLDPDCATAATDGKRMFFGPAFLDSISDAELEFVMLHEVLHVALAHMTRGKHYDPFLFNIACDIVVNSNILQASGGDTSAITLAAYGISMHLAPNGSEGWQYTAEQVYHMLIDEEKKQGGKQGSSENTADNEQGNGSDAGTGNAPTGPTGKQGRAAKAAARRENADARARAKQAASEDPNAPTAAHWDDHTAWGRSAGDNVLADIWQKRVLDAAEVVSIRNNVRGHGNLPRFAERMVEDLKHPQTDWRAILDAFVQEDISDYTFFPPDRRFDEGGFFLPDFNEREIFLTDILFFVDTSASMSDDAITAAFSEIKGAIDQYDGKLHGKLGFFDAAVVEPTPFENTTEFRKISPIGGGGTSFHVIFDYVREQPEPPLCIIILTDGFAPFPDEDATAGIPVLWLLNNREVDPPWGKVAHIDMDAYER